MEYDNEYIESILDTSNSNSKKYGNQLRELKPRRYWINEYIKRYEFFSKFLNGKILDCKSNNFASFHSAKILLNNNVSDVFSFYTKTRELSKRTYSNGKINFENFQEKNIESLHFDGIISFETTFENMNLEKTIKEFSILLNEKGKLIISIINKEKINESLIPKDTQNIISTKKNFLEILRKYFSNIELYSQIIIEEKTPSKINSQMKSLRSIGVKFLSKFDKNRTFYLNYIQETTKKIDKKNSNALKISNEDYIPILNNAKHEPYYIIAVCEK